MKANDVPYFLLLFGLLLSIPAAAQPGSSNRRAQLAFEKAGDLLRNQQYEHAIASLEKAVSIDPEFAAAYQQLGDIYRRQRGYEIAAKKYKEGGLLS